MPVWVPGRRAPAPPPLDEFGPPLLVRDVDAFGTVDLNDARELGARKPTDLDGCLHRATFAHGRVASTGRASTAPTHGPRAIHHQPESVAREVPFVLVGVDSAGGSVVGECLDERDDLGGVRHGGDLCSGRRGGGGDRRIVEYNVEGGRQRRCVAAMANTGALGVTVAAVSGPLVIRCWRRSTPCQLVVVISSPSHRRFTTGCQICAGGVGGIASSVRCTIPPSSAPPAHVLSLAVTGGVAYRVDHAIHAGECWWPSPERSGRPISQTIEAAECVQDRR